MVPTADVSATGVLNRLVRFGLAGALGIPAHFLTLIALVELGGAQPVVGTIAGSAAGALVNYFLNRRFTFESTIPHRTAGPRFVAVAVATGILNAILVYLGVDLLGQHYLVVQVIATLIVFITNFMLSSAWTFREENSA